MRLRLWSDPRHFCHGLLGWFSYFPAQNSGMARLLMRAVRQPLLITQDFILSRDREGAARSPENGILRRKVVSQCRSPKAGAGRGQMLSKLGFGPISRPSSGRQRESGPEMARF